MSLLEKFLKRATDVLSWISVFTITAMMLLAVLDVILRIFFKSPLMGATELIQILNVGIILSLGTGSITNQNVTVNFVLDKAPRVPRFVIEIIMDFVNAVLMLLIAWRSYVLMGNSIKFNNSYSLLRIPEWPFIILVIIGFLGGFLGVVYIIINRIRTFRQGGDKSKEGDNEQ